MAEFTMPSLGADMVEGTLLEWLVKPGDKVTRGDVIAVVDTSKSAVDVECFETGVIAEILVGENKTVPVGTPLALITTDAPEKAAPASPIVVPLPRVEQPTPTAARMFVSPIVRKLAAEAGVDLTTLRGTGRGGAPTRRDVELAAQELAEKPEAVIAPERRQEPASVPVGAGRKLSPYARRLAAELGVDSSALPAGRALHAADIRAIAVPGHHDRREAAKPEHEDQGSARMREAIATAMSRSNREIPHYYLATTIDLARCQDWLHEHNRAVPIDERLVPAALLLKATALAAFRVPVLNGHWVDGGFVPATRVDLGVAVSLRGGGLLVPVLRDAATVSLPDLMRWLRDAVTHARTGRLRSSELGAASLTVTNLGDLGVEVVHGVIHPPQVALVGFGAVVERPWAVDGLLGIRPVVSASLAADHRASDGAVGGRFLSVIDKLLRRPEDL